MLLMNENEEKARDKGIGILMDWKPRQERPFLNCIWNELKHKTEFIKLLFEDTSVKFKINLRKISILRE